MEKTVTPEQRKGYRLEDITAPRYRVGDLAKAFNITTETIRYYEKIGVIEAHRTESGIRYFDSTSIISLFMLRYKQVYGFSNQEIASQQKKSSIKELSDLITEKAQVLSKEIQLLEYRLNKTKEALKELNELENSLNQIKIEVTPEIVMWDYWEEYRVAECSYIQAGLLDEYFPLTKNGFLTHWKKGQIRFTPADRNYGLMMEKELAEKLEIDLSGASVIIPSMKCCSICISDYGGYMVDQLSFLAEEMEKKYDIIAPPWGTVLFSEYPEGKRIWYFKIYFPIK